MCWLTKKDVLAYWNRYGVASICRLLKLYVSFAKEPFKRDDILRTRPIILRSLLIVATPYPEVVDKLSWRQAHTYTNILVYMYIYVYMCTHIPIGHLLQSVCVCVHMALHLLAYMCIYIPIYLHTCIYMYTCVYIYPSAICFSVYVCVLAHWNRYLKVVDRSSSILLHKYLYIYMYK